MEDYIYMYAGCFIGTHDSERSAADTDDKNRSVPLLSHLIAF